MTMKGMTTIPCLGLQRGRKDARRHGCHRPDRPWAFSPGAAPAWPLTAAGDAGAGRGLAGHAGRRGRRASRCSTIPTRRCGRPPSGPWSDSAPSTADDLGGGARRPVRGGPAAGLRGGGRGSRATGPRPCSRPSPTTTPTVVEVAAWASGEREPAEPGVVAVLATLATEHADALVREAAVAALGAIGDAAGLPAILAAIDDKATVRRRAVIALAPFEGAAVDAALARGRGRPRLAGAPGRRGPQRLATGCSP